MIVALRAPSLAKFGEVDTQGRWNEGRAKGGNADGKGNFGLMNYIYKVVDVNPQSTNQEILIMRKSKIYMQ